MKFLLYNKHAINQAPIVGVFVVLMMLLSGTAYEFLYHLHRSQTVELWAIFVLLFTMYLFFTRFNIAQTYYYPLLLVAVLFRVLSLATISNLSDDCYRFVWDGRVWIGGINPFLYLPIHFLDGTYTGQPIAGINQLLFEQLNSPHYYSVYPPVCQYLFAFAAKLSKGNLLANFMWLKIFLLLFEMGTLALLHSFCTSNTISRQNVLQYALCPLVIVELVGNTHFEAACIFFHVVSYILLAKAKKHLLGSGIRFGS